MKAVLRGAVVIGLLSFAVVPWALRGVAQPSTATAQTFASRLARLSEPGGDFDTDNLISNEGSYLEVIPALKAAGATGGAYLGVGPDQNFSYIAQIRPAIAFIIDIRRDNLLLHLLFKALFTSSRTRVEYLSSLTGRPVPDPIEMWREATLDRIVSYIDDAKSDAATRQALDRRLRDAISRFGVPLTAVDFSTIQRFHHAFIDAGLSLKFESRGRPPRSAYPTLRDLLLATDRAGRPWNYLAAERDFQFVKALQDQDLIIPVVGDLGGTQALGAIADLMASRGDRLSAFYISNVETYLYGEKSMQFVRNVRRLPSDARSVIIRSIFRASMSSSEIQPVGQFLAANRP